ncbi:hypothetical protein BDF14DRAFT_1261943 [Spinellus fusiger]|nr:hypothetical protein BDF14DRAFT_1261943 [Spinellus fusiger]
MRPVIKPSKPLLNPKEARKVELTQLERRYRSSFRTLRETEQETVVRFLVPPSDPDFPFDLEALQLQLTIPAHYPTTQCALMVMNTDIPRGIAFHLERGYEIYANQRKNSLVRQMDWLDKNMEALLQQPPVPTMKFVAHGTSYSEEIVGGVAAIDKELASLTLISAPAFVPTSASVPVPVDVPVPAPTPAPIHSISYTASQREEAGKMRQQQMNQLNARFRNSTQRENKDGTIVELSMPLTDFTVSSQLGDQLKIKYSVPKLYPLVPCSIDVITNNIAKVAINVAFDIHVKSTDQSLFSHLNWLHHHLPSILSEPIPTAAPTSLSPSLLISPPIAPTAAAAAAATTTTITTTATATANILTDTLPSDRESRVIYVSRPQHLFQQETSTQQETSANTLPEESPQPPPPVPLPSSNSTVKKGIAIRLINPQLKNVSLFHCISLRLIVKCARCSDTTEIENILPENESPHQQKKERWTTCSTCSSILGVKFIGDLMHENATIAGYLQLAGCTPFDILHSSFLGTCCKCMEDIQSPVRMAPNHQPISLFCFHCHTKMTICLGDYKFVAIGEGGERLKADQQQVMKLKSKKKTKEDLLTVGQPLPHQGTCQHYKKSKRWFRFSCCHRLYMCDHCHDAQQDHPYELAKRHVCGLCSREQPIGPMCPCGHVFERDHQRSAFWEGGQGIRDKTAMSRKVNAQDKV